MSWTPADFGLPTWVALAEAAAAPHRATLAGKTITVVIPGALVEDTDGYPAGAEPNTTFTAHFNSAGTCTGTDRGDR